MKRIHFSCVAVVLLTAGTVAADLTVYKYALGQPVTLDTNTAKYWHWNLADFINMTYDEQVPAIAGLGSYGNTAGGGHMAAFEEVQALWTYLADSITAPFGPSLLDSSYTSHLGRHDYPAPPSIARYLRSVYIAFSPEGSLGSARLALTVQSIQNTLANLYIGGWGTRTGNDWSFVVPAGRKPMGPQVLRTKPYRVTPSAQAAHGP